MGLEKLKIDFNFMYNYFSPFANEYRWGVNCGFISISLSI